MVENFFKKIENPNNVRRNLLESSKDIIQNLKGYQKVVTIREKRRTQIKKLNIQLKEISMFVDKLKDGFPAELLATLKEEEEKTKPKEKKTSKKGKKSNKTIVEPSELTKLENTLSDIENKLKRLG